MSLSDCSATIIACDRIVQAIARAVGELGLDVEHAKELLLLTVGFVERAQHLGRFTARRFEIEHGFERCTARSVRGIERERLAIRLERTCNVLEPLLPHASRTERASASLSLYGVGERKVSFEGLGEVLEPFCLLVEGASARERCVLRRRSRLGRRGTRGWPRRCRPHDRRASPRAAS